MSKDPIREIYKDSRQDDMTRLERRKKGRFRRFFNQLLLVLIIFLVTLIFSWYFFASTPAFNGQGIVLSVDAPKEISSGSELIYIVSYSNLESVPLRSAELQIKYPDGFAFQSASPKPSDGEKTWTLGTIPSGESGKVEVKGKLVGEKDGIKTVTGVLNYIPANFSSEFKKVISADTTIKSSPLSLKLNGPNNALAGEKVVYSVTLKNSGDSRFENLQLVATYPEGFSYSTASLDPNEENRIWNFPGLDPQESREIKVEGQVAASVQGNLELKWQLGVGSGRNFSVQDESKIITEIVKGDLGLNLIINGASENKGVAFGDTLNFSIPFKNNSDTRLSEFTVKLTVATVHLKAISGQYGSSVIDFDTLRDANKGVIEIAESAPRPTILDSRIITWTKKEVKNLTFLDPNEEGRLDFSVKLMPYEVVRGTAGFGNIDDLAVESTVEMAIGKTGNLKSSTVVKTNTILNVLNTNLKLLSEGRYYDDNGAVLGNGPLPPQVGEETTYKIFWTVSNDLHEIKDVAVFAVLPAEVVWQGKYEIGAGEISYNDTSRTVTWKINRLPVSVPVVKANFDVAVIPAKDQAGDVATLIPRTVLTALDSVSQGKLTQTASAITTDLERDTKAEGKGIVVQPK